MGLFHHAWINLRLLQLGRRSRLLLQSDDIDLCVSNSIPHRNPPDSDDLRILHGVSFWQELKARMHAAFLERQQSQTHTCPRCTFEYIEPIPASNQQNSSTQADVTSPIEPTRSTHPGLSHLASLVRQLNRQAEDDVEAGLSAARTQRASSMASSAGETDCLIPAEHDGVQVADGYGSLEVLTPSTDADVVVKKKKAPKKVLEDKKKEKGTGNLVGEDGEAFTH